MAQNNNAALAFKDRKETIERLIKEIRTKVNQFGKGEKVDWSHVGSLGHVIEELNEIHQFMNC